jgi:hypothetical protein
MQLGYYNVDKARSQAKAYLEKSITTLSAILGLDINTWDLNQASPYPEGSHLHAAYTCLLNEVKAYNKLTGK